MNNSLWILLMSLLMFFFFFFISTGQSPRQPFRVLFCSRFLPTGFFFLATVISCLLWKGSAVFLFNCEINSRLLCLWFRECCGQDRTKRNQVILKTREHHLFDCGRKSGKLQTVQQTKEGQANRTCTERSLVWIQAWNQEKLELCGSWCRQLIKPLGGGGDPHVSGVQGPPVSSAPCHNKEAVRNGAVYGPVTKPPINHEPRPLGQGHIPLAEWLARMACNLGDWWSKPVWALCTLLHFHVQIACYKCKSGLGSPRSNSEGMFRFPWSQSPSLAHPVADLKAFPGQLSPCWSWVFFGASFRWDMSRTSF